MKTILIADNGSLKASAEFFDPVRLKDCHNPNIIITDINEETETYIIEINGKKYRKREQKTSKGSRALFNVMAMTMAMTGGVGMPGLGSERKRPNVDIIQEFELIQNKESNLSRNDRDWVCNQFKYLYEEIKDTGNTEPELQRI